MINICNLIWYKIFEIMMNNSLQKQHPAVAITLFLVCFIAALFIAQFLAFAALFPFLGKQAFNLTNIVSNPTLYPNSKMIILFTQGLISLVSMVVCPIVYMKVFKTKKLHFFTNIPNELYFLATAFLVILALPIIAFVADFNQQMHFPAWMKGFELWAMAKEAELKILTEFITNFDSQAQFWFGLAVIALIPAVGEELMFRGLIQTQLEIWSKNKHVAIWVAAIIFSAIHFQFYGFVPRMLLGALFGYLFVWTKNMLIPMTAHFTNNAFTLLMLHLKNQNKITMDVETTKDLPTGLIVSSAILFFGLLYLYHQQLKKRSNKLSKQLL
jgi:uncharacterized protein